MGIDFLLSLLTAIPGTVVYHLLILLGLLPAAGIVLTEWRHTRSADLRPYLTALAGIISVRVLSAVIAPFHLQTSSLPVVISAPFLYAGELLSILLLVWAFGWQIWGRRSQTLLAVLFVGWLALLAMASGLWYHNAAGQPLTYTAHSWQVPVWYVLSAIAAFGGAAVLLRAKDGDVTSSMVAVLLILGVGAVFGLLGAAILGPLLATGEGIGRLCALIGYPLFAISLYRSALQDLEAYRQDLRELGKESLRQSQELLFLIETIHSIGEQLDLGGKLSQVAANIAMALRADAVVILLIDANDRNVLNLVASHQVLGGDMQMPQQVTLKDYPALRAALREQQVISDAGEEKVVELHTLYDLLGVTEKGPLLVQPVARQGRAMGVLLVYNTPAKPAFTSEQTLLAAAIGVQIAIAVEYSRLYGAVETQTRELRQVLKVHETELRRQDAILESMAEGILVSDAQGRIILVNQALEAIFDIRREDVFGRPVVEVLSMPALKGELDPELLVDLAEPFEATFDLAERHIRVNAAPVLLQDGERLGVAAILQDITREYLAEASKHEFIANISRELRTPLTAIKGYTEVMLSGVAGALPQASEQFLNVIRENTLKMASLTDNIISVAEIERGQIGLQYQSVDVLAVIREVVRQYHGRTEERSLTVDLDMPDDLPPVEADLHRLHLILDNLLSNAVKFTFPNGRITIGGRTIYGTLGQPTYCSIWISDTGVGIPPDEQINIWKRFYRVDNPLSLEAGGLGIGLTITKALVEAHGGRVWVDSTLNHGSTFTVLLPIKRGQGFDGPSGLGA